MRKFAAFKSKKFYIGFRPMQKLKQASKKRKEYNEQAARAAYERLRDMLFQSNALKLRIDALLPKHQKEESHMEGLLAVLAPADCEVVTYSV